MSLPKDRNARNALPIWDGCISYFPDVWAEISRVSVQGNKQHALGDKLHWNTSVSTDHANQVFRHMLDDAAGNVEDDDCTLHLAKAAWRILAMLQLRCWERAGKNEHGEPLKPIDPAVADAVYALSPVDPFDVAPRETLREAFARYTESARGKIDKEAAQSDAEFSRKITGAIARGAESEVAIADRRPWDYQNKAVGYWAEIPGGIKGHFKAE
jgi:hypothetical protein